MRYYTPGPWKAEANGKSSLGTFLVCSNNCSLAIVTADHPADRMEAGDAEINAKLMAAAPELFMALHNLVCAIGRIQRRPLDNGEAMVSAFNFAAALEEARDALGLLPATLKAAPYKAEEA